MDLLMDILLMSNLLSIIIVNDDVSSGYGADVTAFSYPGDFPHMDKSTFAAAVQEFVSSSMFVVPQSPADIIVPPSPTDIIVPKSPVAIVSKSPADIIDDVVPRPPADIIVHATFPDELVVHASSSTHVGSPIPPSVPTSSTEQALHALMSRVATLEHTQAAHSVARMCVGTQTDLSCFLPDDDPLQHVGTQTDLCILPNEQLQQQHAVLNPNGTNLMSCVAPLVRSILYLPTMTEGL